MKTDSNKELRCAIYTRKSVAEGLDKDFNTLDAQREAGESYIASQKHEGWIVIPKHYDDGGFTGGNMERPALQELFDDIKNGKIDIVVVYKVDRLSRSIMDFAKIVELFESHNVSFVSVTQHFNTKDSMGRLTLNILLSFAQFERELISERKKEGEMDRRSSCTGLRHSSRRQGDCGEPQRGANCPKDFRVLFGESLNTLGFGMVTVRKYANQNMEE